MPPKQARRKKTGMSAAETTSNLPMFYTSPDRLSKDVHADLAIKPSSDFSFAAKANAIPIMIAEMPQAMRSYPIVFAGAGSMPLVLTGLKKGENTFIDAKGRWAEGHYIPGYVRRYPFVLAGEPSDDRLTLCIDLAADTVTTTDTEGADPLFEDGEPTTVTQKALKFCEEYQAMLNVTTAAVALMQKHDLLVSKTSKITLPDGDIHEIGGFFSADEAKLNELDDAAFLELRKAGTLGAIYCQLASTHSWHALLSRRAAQA